MTPHITVKNLETTFANQSGAIKVVRGVSYQIDRGRTLGVVGESGSGKSVLSYSLMGVLDPPGQVTGGSFQLGDHSCFDIAEEEMRMLRGKKIAMIFQEPMTALNPVLTVGYQISEQLQAHTSLNPKQRKERAIEMLELVGIPAPVSRYSAYPHELSGGMRQRAMIAMALSCDPEFLIADEPTTALDVTIQAQILNLMKSLQEKFGMTMQFITHDLGVISEMADDVMVMYSGKTFEIGPISDIFNEPAHPYTIALIQAIPRLGRHVSRLPTIPGQVPSLGNLPLGCAFQNRCPRATAICRETEPNLTAISEKHLVACHHPGNSI